MEFIRLTYRLWSGSNNPMLSVGEADCLGWSSVFLRIQKLTLKPVNVPEKESKKAKRAEASFSRVLPIGCHQKM